MSGHSKWSKVKHVKAVQDAKRGKAFTKVIKEITVAARIGGGDPDGNPRLRAAIMAAKQTNMPGDNIKRAIQKGTGELPGVQYEEITYEGYGPGGIAILVEAMTDNKNRTVSEMRYVFSRNNGNMGEAGSVSWMFSKKGSIVIDKNAVDEEKLMEIALEAGADDIQEDSGNFEVLTTPEAFHKVTAALQASEIPTVSAELAMIPQTWIQVTGKEAQQVLKLVEALEDHEDVQKVWANFDISEEELVQLAG
ncbi:YebC/PmpR family DNA-binding transcriptional regulator [bacterium]|nr:YebC/PmpR family DNA-binding transcriptional regulator [bacterium]MCI0604539.1 YebC/PmpR family DNA-binding transcriptional regulator [bacterium]